jgi:asparagine synthase (glutamine-hydrolysing)
MASQNVKVVLGGQGGDEIFGGYARYLVAYLEQCIKSAIFEEQEEGRFVVTLGTIIPNLSLLKQYVPLLKKFWSGGVFEPMDKRYFQLINRIRGNEGIFAPEFMCGYDEAKTFETFSVMFNQPETKSYFNRMTCFDMRTLLHALLQVEDRMSMAVSLESRVPLLDHRIVELVASMPPTLKFADGKTKYVFRQIVKDRVPPEIFNRKDKMGFPVPLSEWFKSGVVRDFVLDTLLSDRAKKRGVLNSAEITKYLDQQKPFDRGLWGALCLELWFKNFIDPPN